MHFLCFINKIPIPQGFLVKFGHYFGKQIHGRALSCMVCSRIVCFKNLSYKKWNWIQIYCERKQTYRHQVIKHETGPIVWIWNTMGWASGNIYFSFFYGGTDHLRSSSNTQTFLCCSFTTDTKIMHRVRHKKVDYIGRDNYSYKLICKSWSSFRLWVWLQI